MKEQKIGSLMVISAAIMWGITGNVAQYLYSISDISAMAVVIIKLLVTGVLLLLWCFCHDGKKTLGIFAVRKNIIHMILLAIIGTAGVQYTFFFCVEVSDAPTATVLQFLYPIMVIIVVSVRKRKKPSNVESICIICAVVGTFFIATHGSVSSLAISRETLFWGLLSAVCLTFFSVYSVQLTEQWGSAIVNGWGMLIGGIVTLASGYSEIVAIKWNGMVISCVGVIAIIGTLFPFVMYLKGVQMIGAVRAGALASVETLTSFLIAITFLNQKITLADSAGMLCVILSVIFPVLLEKS